MASKYWIKLYHEILDDPKMGKLPDNLWRRAIELFLLAGELDQDGELPDTEGIAWKLRITCNVSLQEELQALQKSNIVTLLDNGNWFVVHFAKRQEAVEVNERVKKFRERQKKKAEKSPTEAPKEYVTKRYTDTDTEIDINQEEKEADAAFSQISTFYQNEIGPMSPVIRDKLLQMCKDFPPTWIPPAITLAVEQNVRKLSYVIGILENWKVIGGPQNDKPKNERQQQRNGAINGHRQTYKTKQNGRALDPRAMDTTAIEREIADLERKLGARQNRPDLSPG